MVPTLHDIIQEKGLEFTSRHLQRGSLEVRNAHAHSAMQEIGYWHHFNPVLTSDKSTRGFQHPECGRLLCPALYDWVDPAYDTHHCLRWALAHLPL